MWGHLVRPGARWVYRPQIASITMDLGLYNVCGTGRQFSEGKGEKRERMLEKAVLLRHFPLAA